MDDLLRLLMAAPTVSGEQVSAALGISRAAVWKRVEKLRAQGFDIRSAGRSGYRLLPLPDALDAAALSALLDTAWAGRALALLPIVDSTNAEARRRALEGAPHGLLVAADQQTAGRGRRGRGWLSAPGMGLWMTLLLRPQAQAEQIPCLTLLIALAAARACQAVSGAPVRIKWPNDLVVHGRKLCGILLEMAADLDGVQWVAAGVGINLRQQPEDFPEALRGTAISLAQCMDAPPPRAALAAAFLREVEALYDAWAAHGMAGIRQPYLAASATLGQPVRVEALDEAFTGTAEALDDTGALLVRQADGTLRRVLAADVSVRGVMGYV